ncbi:MAG: hypothetical protein L0H64_00920 [Pseudonocardia sp.]|nr:hypothetical protein [Pseudonocardia sp.]
MNLSRIRDEYSIPALCRRHRISIEEYASWRRIPRCTSRRPRSPRTSPPRPASRYHHSRFNSASVHYAVFFALGGIAFHEGALGHPSAGYLHLTTEAASRFFDALAFGDEVQVRQGPPGRGERTALHRPPSRSAAQPVSPRLIPPGRPRIRMRVFDPHAVAGLRGRLHQRCLFYSM